MTDTQAERGPYRSPLLTPVLLLALTLLTLTGFLIYQAVVEQNTLLSTKAAQEQPLRQIEQIKTQLSALGSATAKLAQQGHAGAKQIVEAMQREGITLKP
jgi:cell division protein FtsB